MLFLSVLAIPTTVTYFTMYEQLKVMVDDMRRSQVQTAASAPAPSAASPAATDRIRPAAGIVAAREKMIRRSATPALKLLKNPRIWEKVSLPQRLRRLCGRRGRSPVSESSDGNWVSANGEFGGGRGHRSDLGATGHGA